MFPDLWVPATLCGVSDVTHISQLFNYASRSHLWLFILVQLRYIASWLHIVSGMFPIFTMLFIIDFLMWSRMSGLPRSGTLQQTQRTPWVPVLSLTHCFPGPCKWHPQRYYSLICVCWSASHSMWRTSNVFLKGSWRTNPLWKMKSVSFTFTQGRKLPHHPHLPKLPEVKILITSFFLTPLNNLWLRWKPPILGLSFASFSVAGTLSKNTCIAKVKAKGLLVSTESIIKKGLGNPLFVF